LSELDPALPNVRAAAFKRAGIAELREPLRSAHKPRILLLYAPVDHPKVRELRDLVTWSEGQVWTSPERHGAMSGILKAQIDWIPLNVGAVRPTQGKTLAVMQVSGGSQSFNAVNQMRVLGRWMRMITIPNQSSVAKAFQEFDDSGLMKASSFYDRVVDVMEELVKFTLLTRDVSHHLTDRYSERVETAAELSQRVNLPAAIHDSAAANSSGT
jgi:arsenical resistance protein ArsH